MDFAKKLCANSVQNLVAAVLKQGPVPRHIGIIMDGNRRFAKKKSMNSVVDGHKNGAKLYNAVCDVCQNLGVKEITLYCFSVDNFNRSEEEVDGIMRVFEGACQLVLDDIKLWHENGRAVEIIGDYRLVTSPRLRDMLAKVMAETRGNSKFKLNLAIAYKGQIEMTTGLNVLLGGLRRNDISPKDLNESLLEDTFTLRKLRPVDLLIRTGGDNRLSDFMMWQCGNAYMELLDGITWPEFGYYHLIRAIFRYQMNVQYCGLQQNDDDLTKTGNISKRGKRIQYFLQKTAAGQWKEIEKDASRVALHCNGKWSYNYIN